MALISFLRRECPPPGTPLNSTLQKYSQSEIASSSIDSRPSGFSLNKISFKMFLHVICNEWRHATYFNNNTWILYLYKWHLMMGIARIRILISGRSFLFNFFEITKRKKKNDARYFSTVTMNNFMAPFWCVFPLDLTVFIQFSSVLKIRVSIVCRKFYSITHFRSACNSKVVEWNFNTVFTAVCFSYFFRFFTRQNNNVKNARILLKHCFY